MGEEEEKEASHRRAASLLDAVWKYARTNGGNRERQRLLETMQTNDCRDAVSAAAALGGDMLSTVFVCAGRLNHWDVLQCFLDHGMNVDVKHADGTTALIAAANLGHEQSVRLLVDHGAQVNIQDNDKRSALLWASCCGFPKIVELLLQRNANPDLQDKYGSTALIQACWTGRKGIAKILLQGGADTEVRNDEGKTAFDLAKTEQIKTLLQNHVNASFVLK